MLYCFSEETVSLRNEQSDKCSATSITQLFINWKYNSKVFNVQQNAGKTGIVWTSNVIWHIFYLLPWSYIVITMLVWVRLPYQSNRSMWKKNRWTQFYVVEYGASVYFFIDLALHIAGSCTHNDYCNVYTCLKFIFLLFYMHLLYQVILLNLFNSLVSIYDRLCGLVVRVSGYWYRGPGFDPRRYQIFWVVVGLERGPLSLVSLVRSIEELLEWKK